MRDDDDMIDPFLNEIALFAFAKLAKWHERVSQSGFKPLNTISRTITNHYQTILN
ncbi:hypothetical protein SGQ83_07990 [Flavobacterium sp. Fl-318]|uniref:Uncharacterized protein n=1 Tax=Flavobacterium cupriresistens TaxID=2893885 RepID=A0ABU4RAL1_9FLAO|nr:MULTISPECIES: transposase [unclassified Flavobacterium]MDX6189281.1 hypothetical protein [Flavobacterium sp. Fl-318]UFH41377.1 transposase [Flavobacterium sp. F-323]